MSDWQVGDLAVCVDASSLRSLKEGAILPVTRIIAPAKWHTGEIVVGLCFEGVRNLRTEDGDFRCTRFRKILPDKHEECEPEFVTLLKRIKIGVEA